MPEPLLDKQAWAVEEVCNREFLLVEFGTGTGKTRIYVESIDIMVRSGDTPILLLVPNSLMEQTVEQFEYWLGEAWVEKHLKILGPPRKIERRREALKRGNDDVYILSHESLSYGDIREALAYRKWAAVIVDEGSRFRNHSGRTRTLMMLQSRSATRYVFTGRLQVKTPSDIFYVMNFLDKGLFGTMNRAIYINNFCLIGGYMGREPIDVRPEKLEELRTIMNERTIRCELRDLRKLPKRVLQVYRVDISADQRKAYEQMRIALKVEIERTGEPEFRSQCKTYATRLQRLQEISAGFARNIDGEVVSLPSPKTREMVEILSDTPEIPTIVWYWWTPERDRIATMLSKAKIPYRIFGAKGARQDFESGKVNVFIAQLAKGGYGLNLPRAIRMIYHSLPWDLDVYLQSQERNMRLTTKTPGRRKDGTKGFLEVIHLLVRNSVDEYVRMKLLTKAGISEKISKSQALEMLRSV